MKTNQLPDGQLMEIIMTADPDVFDFRPFFGIARNRVSIPVEDLAGFSEIQFIVTLANVSRFNAEAAFKELDKFPAIDKLIITNSHFLIDPDDGLPSPFEYLLQTMKSRRDISSYDISDVFYQDHQLTALGKGLWNAANNKESGRKHDWITSIIYKNIRQTKDNEILDNFVLRNRKEPCIHCSFSTPTELTPSSMDRLYDLCLKVDTYNQTENPEKTFIFADNVAYTGSMKFLPKPKDPAKLAQPSKMVSAPTFASIVYSMSYSAVKKVEDTIAETVEGVKNLINPQKEDGAEMERGSTSSRWEMVRPTYWVKKLEPSEKTQENSI